MRPNAAPPKSLFRPVLCVGVAFVMVALSCALWAKYPLPTGYVLKGTDGKLEILDCPGGVRYRFAAKVVRAPERRLVFSYVLNAVVFGDAKEASKAIAELLPAGQSRREFLGAVYAVRDSKLWADGNAYAAYDVMLNRAFGAEGFALANEGVAINAKACRFERLNLLFFLEFVSNARPEAAKTLHDVANCALTSRSHYTLALASAVGLAHVGKTSEALSLLDQVENIAQGNESVVATSKEVRAFIADMPNEEAALYSRLEKLLL